MKKPRDLFIGSGKKVIITAVICVAVILITLVYYFYSEYTVETVSVMGNTHYTVAQIEDMIMTGPMGHNSLFLSAKYKNKSVTGIPFIETMDVSVVSPKEIAITVYEKAVAGYVQYLDRFMYFDKDGIVVESSTIRQNGVPQVTGLNFDYVVLHDVLPVDRDGIFKDILSITQLLSKYSIDTDRIHFDENKNVTLFFKDARVKLGTLENIDEKMLKLQGIAPNLGTLKGVLYMENYTEDSDSEYITFQRDDVRQHKELYDPAIGETVSADSISEDEIVKGT